MFRLYIYSLMMVTYVWPKHVAAFTCMIKVAYKMLYLLIPFMHVYLNTTGVYLKKKENVASLNTFLVCCCVH